MPTFSELGLGVDVLKAIEALGYQEPTPIQQQAIPLLLSTPTDLVALAQTGTGKTAAFGLPLIDQLDFNSRDPLALILAPTRELCVQIANDLAKFAQFAPGASIVPVYGGAAISTQIRSIKQGAHIIVATPGRLIDLLGRKAVKLHNVNVVVLDEADEMLNMGFKEDIDHILASMPEERNIWLFSATMPPEITRLTEQFLHNPVRVEVARAATTASTITQGLIATHSGFQKRETLRRLIRDAEGFKNAIIAKV